MKVRNFFLSLLTTFEKAKRENFKKTRQEISKGVANFPICLNSANNIAILKEVAMLIKILYLSVLYSFED